MVLNLAVLYVEYDEGKYPGSFSKLKSYLEKVKSCKKTFFIIDNFAEGDYIEKQEENIYRIGGNNSEREFSGWQKGLDTLNSMNIPYDIILFVNDAFLVPGRSYLENYASKSLILKSLLNNAVVGRIDDFGEKVTVLNYTVNEWVCTNCFFVPKKIINKIDNIVTINLDKINDFLDENYFEISEKKQLLSEKITRESLIDGRHVIEFEIAERGDIDIQIELNKSFIPVEHKLGNDNRELGIIINKFEFCGQPANSLTLLGGWYPIEGSSRWISKSAKVNLNLCTNGKLILEGYVPPHILETIYDGEIEITFSIVKDVFKDSAPISKRYRAFITEWLYMKWHSKFQLDYSTWALFRLKAMAILNEALLTSRIKDEGFKIMSYGNKKYY